MNKRILFSILLILTACLQVHAIPARGKAWTVRQPDGTQLRIVVDGDEFCRIVRTEDGKAVAMGEDGYWYYAAYDISGKKRSTGVRVTAANGASAAATAARNIPYGILRARGAQRRAEVNRERSARRVRFIETKAGNNTRKALVILAQFPDLKFKFDRQDFVNMLTKHGYSYAGATGSAMDYFNDQFEGVCDFEFTVSPVVTLSKGFAYYGENNDDDSEDLRAHEAVAEACRMLDPQIDFSQFDCDRDGEVDNIFVFVAGHDEAQGASKDHIWSHQWYLRSAGVRLSLDGKVINSYAISSELSRNDSWQEVFASIGTFCHEYSHSLGLYDLYDTDYEDSGGECNSVWGTTSLMDHGNYNNNGNTPPNYNSMELWMLGLGTAENLDIGKQTLFPLSVQKRFFVADTDMEGEYFFFECRSPEGWDAYIGGSGMLIYHYDASSNDAGYSDGQEKNLTAEERWWYNEANANPDHPCFDLIESVPIARDISQVFWPNGIHTVLSATSTPSFDFWSGKKSGFSLDNIIKDDSSVSFYITCIQQVETFQDGAIIQWGWNGNDVECSVIISPATRFGSEFRVKSYLDNFYSYTFDGLMPETTYKVSIFDPNNPGNVAQTEFTTKRYYSDGYPFIYLNSADRNSDGSFRKGGRMPLRVFNARGAANVSWSFPESCLSSDGSGYYTVQNSCTLKAVVDYEDGTRDVITKQITVK